MGRRAKWFSLPLMGIGNVRHDGAIVAQVQGLITPHGDRKRAASSSISSWPMSLITPHGDRKR